MEQLLIKPYEISIWKDKLVDKDTDNPYYKEIMLAKIGSNEASSPNECFNITLQKNINGEIKLSFSMLHQYFDETVGQKVQNPLVPYLVNERKVKLKYDNEWYDFIIKKVEESSDNVFQYECTSLFVNELSKGGYEVVLSTDITNNQGTIFELAKQVMEPTDWVVVEPGDGAEDSDYIRGFVQEPLYKGVLNTDIDTVDVITLQSVTVASGETVYFFYSTINNKQTKDIHIMRELDDNQDGHAHQWVFDDNNVAKGPNYRLTEEITYTDNIPNIVNSIDVELHFQGYRYVYGSLSRWDPITEKYVDLYKVNDREIYHYTDYEYATSDILVNYVTNGHNFELLSEGDILGWSAATPYTSADIEQTVGIMPYPPMDLSNSISLGEMDAVKNYLQIHFNGKKVTENGTVKNTVFNSGIQDQASIVDGFKKGEQYVLRVKYGTTHKDNPDGSQGAPLPELALGQQPHLKALIAGYTIDEDNVREIDSSRIYFDVGNATAQGPLNNVVSGGEIDNTNRVYRVKNEYGYDIYTPSTDKIYINNATGQDGQTYVWAPSEKGSDDIEGQFILFNANRDLQYYYYVMECQIPLSNKDLTESDVGIFVYTDRNNGAVGDTDSRYYYWIDDIQIFKYREDGDGHMMTIGNIPTATSITTDYWYIPDKNKTNEEIERYATLSALAEMLDCSANDIKPVYNEKCEQIASIEAEHSNYFNIIQDLCEKFQCWAKFEIEHEDNGEIKLDENKNPIKKISFHEYVGKDNFAGFKYGINLDSIQRTFSSDEIVSKLIVANNDSEYVQGGLTIQRASSNPFGEDYILNFAYYLNHGLIDNENFYEDLNTYQEELKSLNTELDAKNTEYLNLINSARNIESEYTVYNEYLKAARIDLTEAKKLLKNITGFDYEDFKKNSGSKLKITIVPTKGTRKAKVNVTGLSSITGLTVVDEDNKEIYPSQQGKVYYDGQGSTVRGNYLSVRITSTPGGYTFPYEKDLQGNITGRTNETNDLYLQSPLIFTPNSNPADNGVYCYLPLASDDNDSYEDCLGRIIADQTVINGYKGTVPDLKAEYSQLMYQAEGIPTYSMSLSTINDKTKIEVSDFFDGLELTLNKSDSTTYVIESSTTQKVFEWDEAASFTLNALPDGYQLVRDNDDIIAVGDTFTLTTNTDYKFFLQPTAQTSGGLKAEIEALEQEKDRIERNFYKKYSRFIQEGTWTSEDYVDNELYYLAALQVSNTSAMPKTEYSIKVLEVSELENLHNYTFNIGDKTYIEDVEFFGWTYPGGIKTPVREEVIVSEVIWHLDKPEENEITIQNYKTRFEDLFQRIGATIQTVEYNNGSYMRAASTLDSNGLINSDLLTNSLSSLMSGGYLLSSGSKVKADMYGITVTDLENPSNLVRLGGKGLMVSEDGGQNWDTALTPQGIDIKYIRAGAIDAGKITIMDGEQPSFRWDSTGINAFSFDEENPDDYDYSKFVRFDKFGLYGVEGIDGLTNFAPSSLEDIKDKASFGAVWDEFFVKSKYTDGYVSMSSTDDFKVVRVIDGNEINVVQIGKLDTDEETGENIYGISIKDTEGNQSFVANSQGDVTLTGTMQSKNYSVSDLLGWKIDQAGDATFNNVSVRGSIHAAVFEYDEVQAVGGILYVRPSTAVTDIIGFDAEPNENDLIITVENPNILTGNFCRISNSTDSGISNNVYDYIKTVKTIEGNEYTVIILQNYGDDSLTGLIGSAFIDLGESCEDSGTGDYTTTKNYAIGINSSTSNLQMPAQAITLFETNYNNIDDNVIVSQTIKDVFGTLPELGSDKVNNDIYDNYLRGTQGLYTDNIYIGGATQYITYYGIDDNNKYLDIKASSLNISVKNNGNIINVIETTNDGNVNINSNQIILGNKNTAHIEINEREFSIYRDDTNRVAYINQDKLVIPKTVVLNEMNVGNEDDGLGQWSWTVHKVTIGNEQKYNLCLKWLE